jgi:hypothetical protein
MEMEEKQKQLGERQERLRASLAEEKKQLDNEMLGMLSYSSILHRKFIESLQNINDRYPDKFR